MHLFRRLLFCSLLAVVSVPSLAQSAITYTVEPVMADKTYRVRVDIPRNKDLTVRVQMPVWAPGAYFVGNFATNVADVTATDSGRKPLKVYHPEPNTWEIGANGARSVQVQYTVKNADLETGGNGPRRGHVSGPRTYMYVVGRKAEPVELDLLTPAGAKLWNVACSLDPLNPILPHDAVTIKVNRFKAPTYDVLADAPIEMGDFAEERFTSFGKPHSVVLYGDFAAVDRTKLVEYCKRIADVETAFFNDAPYNRYVFEFRCAPQSRGAGGLEHLGSTEIGTVGTVNDRLRSVIAHEYFHLWNVKRIRPSVLGPFNYVDPPHTANLWWSEGVTSYYGDLLSQRAGLITRDEYLKHLADTIGQLQNNDARLKVSADESSLRVWEANNSQGLGLSYYTKGELIGLLLDLKVRQVTGGKASLDDAMRLLYAQVKHGEGPGFEEDDIKRAVNHVAMYDLSDFYDRLARSTEEMPWDECLGYAGLALARVEPPRMVGDAGMTTRRGRGDAGPGVEVASVTAGGAADKAGIKAGDRITAVDGSNEPRALFGALAAAKPDDKVKLTVSTGGASREVELTMGSRSVYSYTLTANAAASPEQVKLRDNWLAGKTAAPVAAASSEPH
ncbi:MAG TPA: PDZ domain-containing protein [Chthonomonadaceae bacterium]|nr:PDZ domain-containing protein [Chthonomonadaceae bacterium]